MKPTQSNRGVAYWVDDLLALDALIFLTSAILSNLSIHSNSKKVYFEDIADKFFMMALIFMGVVVLLLTYQIV